MKKASFHLSFLQDECFITAEGNKFKNEITEELYGILSCVEFDANYDYRDDMERLEATYGREAIMDALCCVCPDAEEKLCDQANYFLEQLKTNEYDYFILQFSVIV